MFGSDAKLLLGECNVRKKSDENVEAALQENNVQTCLVDSPDVITGLCSADGSAGD